MSDKWKYLLCFIVYCILLYFSLRPVDAHGQTWSATVQKYSPNKECTELVLHCIERESGGNPNARNGQHLGLLQFNDNWGSADKRLDPEWSIRRIVRVYESTGRAGIYRHWCKWHGCGRSGVSGSNMGAPRDNDRERSKRKREFVGVLEIQGDIAPTSLSVSRLCDRQSFARLARMEGSRSGYNMEALSRYGGVAPFKGIQ